jgi:hypothetical protein
MLHLDTPIAVSLLVGLGLLLVALPLIFYRAYRGMLGRGLLLRLTGLRLLAGLLLLALLLNPYRTHETPDAAEFKVALIADASGSMETEDCRGDRSRLQVVQQALQLGDSGSLLKRLGHRYQSLPFLATEKPHAFHGRAVESLPGSTALGDVLSETLNDFPQGRLGAVVLLSDGASNTGTPPLEVAKTYRKRQIPITCIGIGETSQPGDVSLRFVTIPEKGTKDHTLTLSCELRNTLAQPFMAEVELASDGVPLAKQQITIPAGGDPVTLPFETRPHLAGMHVYSLRLTSPAPGDHQAETDIDFAAVKIAEPDQFKILYLSGAPNWEHKFIRNLAQANEQLSLASVIQTGPQSYHVSGLPEGELPADQGFPEESALFNTFDVLMLDLRILNLLSPKAVQSLENFAANRGGGLLFFGPLPADSANLPEAIRPLLPVLASQEKILKGKRSLQFDPNQIFRRDPAGVLKSYPAPYLPGESPLQKISAFRKGASSAAFMPTADESGDNSQLPILVAQRYGSGRTAMIATESTWRWTLGSDLGQKQHETFWNNLLIWLGSASRPRMQAVFAGKTVTVGTESDLALDLRSQDFQPSQDARVEAIVTAPSGKSQSLTIPLAGDLPGRYSVPFAPEEAGAYSVSASIKFGDETQQMNARFLAARAGVESRQTAYNEELLRNIARISGGQFFRYTELDQIDELPLNPHLPTRLQKHYLGHTWWVMATLLGLLLLDLWTRRRYGLK